MSDVRNVAGVVSREIDSAKLTAYHDVAFEPLDSTS